MSLTDEAVAELAEVEVTRPSARLAEVVTSLRMAGEIQTGHEVGAGAEAVRVTAKLRSKEAALRLYRELDFLFSYDLSLNTPESKSAEYEVVVQCRNADFLRRVGLVTRAGVLVRGLPSSLVLGDEVDAEAAWRGAFLAAGVLNDPGRSTTLEVPCPGPELALALVGCARKLGMTARTKETRGVERVVLREPDEIGSLLTRMGAHATRLKWEDLLAEKAANAPAHRLVNFDDANLRRSAGAANRAAARLERAFAILGDAIPDHLLEAGKLRVAHREASLEELGRLAEPHLTKDAVAGRIRRLLSMADKQAQALGIPDTQEAAKAAEAARAAETAGETETAEE